jgi:hypothetical protein
MKTLSITNIAKLAQEDHEVHEAMIALLRTCINFLLSFIDLIPFAGEAISWLADLAKLIRFFSKRIGWNVPIDLTPDVSLLVAMGTEIPDVLFGTAIPSHLVETVLQLKADWPRIQKGLKKIQQNPKKFSRLARDD